MQQQETDPGNTTPEKGPQRNFYETLRKWTFDPEILAGTANRFLGLYCGIARSFGLSTPPNLPWYSIGGRAAILSLDHIADQGTRGFEFPQRAKKWLSQTRVPIHLPEVRERLEQISSTACAFAAISGSAVQSSWEFGISYLIGLVAGKGFQYFFGFPHNGQ